MSGSGNWMRRLAQHYGRSRRTHPDDRLLIVFDIDGTILDRRHMVRARLLEYDRVHNTDHFRGLEAAELNAHETDVDRFLATRDLPPAVRDEVLDWCLRGDWRPEPAPAAMYAYPGVLDVIRWFQLQRSSFVGLNTDRPARLRDETLRSLNSLGAGSRVRFESELLHMTDSGEGDEVIASKLDGLDAFARAGYRTFAVVDDEPAVI